MKVLVTGGSGFIGAALIRYLIAETGVEVVNLDALTYAATPEALGLAASSQRYSFEHANICDRNALDRIFETHQPDLIMHLAAESHVDRSIDGPETFIETNITGTMRLLEAVRRHNSCHTRFHHVSTDEVFGSLQADDPAFTESTPYAPRSPYSASKAASDHLVRAWGETFGLNYVMSNCSNNYGPWQYPEKLIPVLIAHACAGKPMPIYGTGQNIRDWLHVNDHAAALWKIASQGATGESYNVGGRAERSNMQVAKAVCEALDLLRPDTAPHDRLITFVTDRPGHDARYAIDPLRIERELGWHASFSFDDAIKDVVFWYLQNETWWRSKISVESRETRLGLGGGGASAT
ncbi:MAG: dTDP-glucose 4,6-dehydratase [Paracoccaceae bacterium]